MAVRREKCEAGVAREKRSWVSLLIPETGFRSVSPRARTPIIDSSTARRVARLESRGDMTSPKTMCMQTTFNIRVRGSRIATVRVEMSWEGGASSSSSGSLPLRTEWAPVDDSSEMGLRAEYLTYEWRELLFDPWARIHFPARLEKNLALSFGALAMAGFKTSQPRLTSESASMMARETHTIQALLPSSQLSTGPGAQPRALASGDRTPQPSMAPKSMCMQVDGPMIIP